ncbi:CCA tRNA nucleotidyltransferase [Sphingomonas baiyangensis]|uniref:CCA tRNA nucleotidyltransferase n=1 Tax=Sphingomonas baiyangensis TaxID=2572576 RepID=A0A4U1L9Y8_9SPHN|nr:CCA tRNA nucleotidyltransferase [Sphingomonas baiyangensis]TKD53220.1 CCA tRNA nucleotidyltransferase [Sphingomonas baiyangensis]
MGDLTLAGALWHMREGFDLLVRALGGDGEARLVGGAVRDTLLGLPVVDLDLATVHAPESVVERVREAGFKAVPTGMAHGTITAVLPSGPVEVTTLRRDVSTDGRHATVAFTDDWRADAGRRDFTINALYAEPSSGRLHDWFGGLDDLAARRVRFIGDPLVRIAEDHLRILRFFRFLARFGDTPDVDGLAACTARARDLMALSRERIADELRKLLVARDAPRIVALMHAHGIFAPVLPEIDDAGVARLAALAAREAAAGIAPDAMRRLAALLPADAAINEAVGARLKLSNSERKRLASAIQPPASEGAAALAYRIGIEGAIDRLLLAGGDPAVLAGFVVPRLDIGGGMLVEKGVRRGPDVARLLRRIEDQWIAEGFPDRARQAEIADALVAHWLNEESSRSA